MVNNALPSDPLQPQPSPTDLPRAIMMLMLCGVIFFSGFTAIGTFVVGTMKENFYAHAVQADGKVENIQSKQHTKTVEKDGRKWRETVIQQIVSVQFKDQAGREITASFNDGETTEFAAGDDIDVYYDPENPTTIQSGKDMHLPNMLKRVSGIALIVCLVSLGIAFILGRQPDKAR